MKVLVLGASGMLGNAMIRVLAESPHCEVFGSVRSATAVNKFGPNATARIIHGVDVENGDSLLSLFTKVKPQAVINCVGLVKQLAEANDPMQAVSINSLLPHRLSRLCELVGARLVHVSTDCVFSGRKGNYHEDDEPDAQDLYGRSKLLGEVEYRHAITLRTSIIGHELASAHGLIDWFLTQRDGVKGYTKAIFSGVPTCELSRVVRDFVLPRPALHGLFQVAAEPITKYDLLQLVNLEYGKGLRIEPDETLKIDRSLNGSRFRKATGYVAPPWTMLVAQMRAFN